MGAPIGNQFWKARATHGREKTFSDPEALRESCEEYFQWIEDNPLKEEKAFNVGGEVKIIQLSKMRAMTYEGLCNFLDITVKTWRNYKEDNDLLPVITRVEQIIKEQKFTGAAADLLNANIIARDLGLSDKSKHELTGKDGDPLNPPSALTADTAAQMIADFKASLKED